MEVMWFLKELRFSKYKQFVQNCFNVLPRQGLHAQTLGFTHPDTGEYMSFTTPLPEDMACCIEKMERLCHSRTDVKSFFLYLPDWLFLFKNYLI